MGESYVKELNTVIKELNTNINIGLTTSEVKKKTRKIWS